MPIKSQYLNHPFSLSVGVGLYKGNPLAIVFQVSDDGARPLGISSAEVVLDGTQYKINVSERFHVDWIPADIRIKNMFRTPEGVLISLIDAVNIDVSSVVRNEFIPTKVTSEGFITLWAIPKIFAESTVSEKEITYNQFGELLETKLISGVVPTAQDTISKVEISTKPTGNVGVALTPANPV